jgi:hypothetical protein
MQPIIASNTRIFIDHLHIPEGAIFFLVVATDLGNFGLRKQLELFRVRWSPDFVIKFELGL